MRVLFRSATDDARHGAVSKRLPDGCVGGRRLPADGVALAAPGRPADAARRLAAMAVGLRLSCGGQCVHGLGGTGTIDDDDRLCRSAHIADPARGRQRSEEHTSELQSLMRISYAV